jgi:hypothetical protein
MLALKYFLFWGFAFGTGIFCYMVMYNVKEPFDGLEKNILDTNKENSSAPKESIFTDESRIHDDDEI